MSNIWKLPPEIVSRIAAGEVVERPMNVVKELVENSIDANSTKIIIKILNGGLDGVSVQDNGEGISPDEIELAFQLHTTSKLANHEIQDVATLGFRGEALASITAVSLVECNSITNGISSKVVLEGGRVMENERTQSSLPNGTLISVSSLFYNTPVRKKFLKKPATERKKIIELVSHFTLSYPEIHFILEEPNQSGKNIIRMESPSRKGLLAVIFDILGAEIANSLVQIKGNLTNWRVEGFISKPNMVKSDRSTQYISVNGRIIRHNELQSKIESAYGSQLMKSSYPIIILKIAGESSQVDFNIHPQKSEIRFRDDDPIFEEISELVINSLEENSKFQLLPKKSQPMKQVNSLSSVTQKSNFGTSSISKKKSNSELQANKRRFSQTTLVENVHKLSSSGVKILGHIMNKFAVADGLDGELWLIDVHAADERVKFEYFTDSSHRKALAQQMLEPISVELLPNEKSIILENSNQFEKYGLKISNSSGNSILIHSFPVYFDQILTRNNMKKLLEDIVSYLSDTTDNSILVDSPFDKIEYGIVARLACHGSIRSGYPISNDIVKDVVDNLLKCKNPWTCAHGRPTVLKVGKSTLEGWFKR